jgi:predicted secreted protein
MSGFVGRRLLFSWKGTEILGVREKSVAFNGEPVNITSGENNGWQTLLNEAGENSIVVQVSGVTKSSILRRDWMQMLREGAVEIEWPDGTLLQMTAVMSTYTETGTYNDAATFEATFTSSGEPTFTPYE